MQEPSVEREPGEQLTLCVHVPAAGRFAGTVAEDGAERPRGFDGWIDFMGTVAELRQRAQHPPAPGR